MAVLSRDIGGEYPARAAVHVIRQVTTYQFALPLPHGREVKTALHTISGAEIVLVEIRGDKDCVGVGYAMTFRRQQSTAIRLMIHELALSMGNELAPRSQWNALVEKLDFTGKAGLGIMALSAIDTALWDLRSQTVGLPLYRYLGSNRTAIPLYTAGGWLSYTTSDVVKEALGYRDEGFAKYKMKVGHRDGWRTDLDRVGQVQAAVGDTMSIYVDANQSWSRVDALVVGRALQDLGVEWFEEPVAAEDLVGSAELARRLDMPVVVGQSAHLSELKTVIDTRAGDILMPDFMRCGGITGWMDTARLAAASHMPITSHAFTEISAHLMASCSNATVAEYIPRWFDSMYVEAPVVINGEMQLSDRPGLGLTVSAALKEDLGVDDGHVALPIGKGNAT